MTTAAGGCRRSLGLAGAGLLLVGVAVAQPVPARAADPTAPVLGVVAPVPGIVAPVLDIQLGESDLRGEARVEQRPRRTTVTLDSTVLFAKDSADLSAKARARIREVGARLARSGPGTMQVTGYTDDLGSAAYGLDLSRRRAAAVSGVLEDSLPGGYRFTVRGRGEADPAAPNDSERNRKLNRRVVVVYEQS